jgi:4-amino-4-deoxy-L-arabinose transferase-like glycosyltransferase
MALTEAPGQSAGTARPDVGALIIVSGAALRLALAAVVPLTVDEAYYTTWAAQLAPGYLDHPPAVAWLAAGGLGLLGRSALAVRVPAIALQAATTLLAASLARARGGARAALSAVLLLQAAPVFSVGAVLMTPDAPLAFAWTGALWAVERAVARDPRWLVLGGAFLGLGALSKLSAGLLAIAVLAAFLATARGRRLLASPWPWPWLGLGAALAVASPAILWNAARGWPAFRYQLEHGLGGRSFSLARLAGSIAAQAGYVSPVVLVLATVAAWRALRAADPAIRSLAFSALPVAAFFTLAAGLTKSALPHWTAPGWLSASILLAIAGTPRLRVALATGFALIAALLVSLALPLPRTPLDELRGWREGAEAAAARLRPGEALAAGHWITFGQIGWYSGRRVAYLGEASAPTFWEGDPARAGAPLLVVRADQLGPGREALEASLGPLDPAGRLDVERGGRTVRRFEFFHAGARVPGARGGRAPGGKAR